LLKIQIEDQSINQKIIEKDHLYYIRQSGKNSLLIDIGCNFLTVLLRKWQRKETFINEIIYNCNN